MNRLMIPIAGTATTSSAAEYKKLNLTGLFYLLKKESGAWVIKNKKKLASSDNKTVDFALKDWCESLDWFTNLFSSANWKVKARLDALKGG